MADKINVMIVDDQAIARNLFEMYLNNSEDFEVVFSVESAAFADTYVLRKKVDLVLMDILMQDGSNGLDAAERIKRSCPDIKIVAVTSMPEASWMERARKIGVESFWYKEASKETILSVMRRTMNGESVYPDTSPTVKLGEADSTVFTDRELAVLRIMTTGASNSEISEALDISENTVKTHIKHMLDKTGFKNRTELAIEARVSGIAVNLT